MLPDAIICLGNRYAAADDAGWRTFDLLQRMALPPTVELVDGGLCGLDLLRIAEGKRQVVFADTLQYAEQGRVIQADPALVAQQAQGYGHAAGLPYLLHLLPEACHSPLPHISIVGAAPLADEAVIRQVAQTCLEIVRHGSA